MGGGGRSPPTPGSSSRTMTGAASLGCSRSIWGRCRTAGCGRRQAATPTTRVSAPGGSVTTSARRFCSRRSPSRVRWRSSMSLRASSTTTPSCSPALAVLLASRGERLSRRLGKPRATENHSISSPPSARTAAPTTKRTRAGRTLAGASARNASAYCATRPRFATTCGASARAFPSASTRRGRRSSSSSRARGNSPSPSGGRFPRSAGCLPNRSSPGGPRASRARKSARHSRTWSSTAVPDSSSRWRPSRIASARARRFGERDAASRWAGFSQPVTWAGCHATLSGTGSARQAGGTSGRLPGAPRSRGAPPRQGPGSHQPASSRSRRVPRRGRPPAVALLSALRGDRLPRGGRGDGVGQARRPRRYLPLLPAGRP